MDLTTIVTEIDALQTLVTGTLGLAVIGVVLAVVTIGLVAKLVRKA